MTTTTPDRVVELWDRLPEAARRTIVDIAEHAATRELALALTAEEERDLEQARADFAHGRTLTIDQFSADMDAFMADLRKQAQVQS